MKGLSQTTGPASLLDLSHCCVPPIKLHYAALPKPYLTLTPSGHKAASVLPVTLEAHVAGVPVCLDQSTQLLCPTIPG